MKKMIDESVLMQEERISLTLRKLYSSYGYGCFKMSKFEEYDLYSKNKNFLLSDRVIAFTDTNGKMMALKPDVTLSIAKNAKIRKGNVLRLFYDENVYRVSDSVGRFKEINQVGLECIGDLDDYNFFEVLCLAALSLKKISRDAVLTISHLGIISAVLDDVNGDKAQLLLCISSKNKQGVEDFCRENGVSAADSEILTLLAESGKTLKEIGDKIKAVSKNGSVLAALSELERFSELCFQATGVTVKVDLSLVSDLNFYNGLIFNGFIKGVPSKVLSGGRYDKLMERLGKNCSAAGFAVYLDLLERYNAEQKTDADIVLLYDENCKIESVLQKVGELSGTGKRVVALETLPDGFTCEKIVRYN
ncbi:MAG: ATP phosphoribosyltransferase regulatory subunit [Christensenellaceae bacterium]